LAKSQAVLDNPNSPPATKRAAEKMIIKTKKWMNKATKHAEGVRKYGDPDRYVAATKGGRAAATKGGRAAETAALTNRLQKYSKMSPEQIALDQAKIMRAQGMTKQADEIEKIIKTGMGKSAAGTAQMAKSAAGHKQLMARMKQGVADFKAGKIDRKEFHGQVKELGQAIINNPASTPQTKEFIKNYVAKVVGR